MLNGTFRVPGLYHYQEFANGKLTVDRSDLVSSFIVINNRSGYTGPRDKSNPDAVHPYSLNHQELALHLSYDSSNIFGGRVLSDGPYLSTTSNGWGWPSELYNFNALYNRLLDKLSDKTRGDLDLSIDILEWHQTAKMAKVVSNMEDFTRTFVRKFGPLKAASSLWLTYNYGIKPLAQDLFGVADELTRVVINKLERFKVRVVDKWRPPYLTFDTKDGPRQYPVTGGEMKISYSLGMTLRQHEFDLSRWSSLNPYSMIWETLPFSFVADWVVNVGGYLRNLETGLLNMRDFSGGYLTRLIATNCNVEFFDHWANGTDTGSMNVYGNASGLDIQRTLLTQYPLPYYPSIDVRLGSSRLLSAASLMSNLLASGGNPAKRNRGLERSVQRNVDGRKPKSAVPGSHPLSEWFG
ncbi:maturation protein [ssRNA phage Zoerhiza.2_28]|uniref:Maturation protein n=2 Tax=Fiersviridae TaxID=2842319 RepID=A0A8S5L2K9_9VIRU|nr:maturation protein [ssRNA phage Zoerhiza.2_28]QDH90113.1 MAG: hypothetical protein H2Rhizo33706_000003 [Leviviridae sp.]DAD52054.1 TPA_asm: maturation protein [ssRNA phage Zoerhiza.2_28]